MKKYVTLLLITLASFVLVIDTTMMNVSIGYVVRDLNTTVGEVQVAISLYTLITASILVLGGKLADRFGTKKIFMIGTILYGIGTVIAALAPNITLLIIGWSVIEGIAAALIMPAAMSLIMFNYSGRDRVMAFAFWGSTIAAGITAGPILGGVFATYASWRWAFGLEAIVVVIIIIFSFIIRKSKEARIFKIDFIGVLLTAIGFASIVYASLISRKYGWWNAIRPFKIGSLEIAPFGLSITPILILIGIIFIVFFILWIRRVERRGDEPPLVSMSVVKNRQFISSAVIHSILNLCLAGFLFITPFYMQTALQYNALTSGLVLMPMTITIMVFSLLAPRFGTRIAPRYIVQAGVVLAVIGLVLTVTMLRSGFSMINILPGFSIFGTGCGCILAFITNLTMESLSPETSNEGAGFRNSITYLGSSLGTAVLGSLLLIFFLSSIIAGVDKSPVYDEAVKNDIGVFLTEKVQQMETAELEKEGKKIIENLTEGQIAEFNVILEGSALNSLKKAYIAMIGFLGVSLIFTFLLPKKKLE